MEYLRPDIYAGLPERSQVMIRIGRKEYDPDLVLDAVCVTLDLRKEDVVSQSRKREYSEARCIAVGLILQIEKTYGLKNLGVLLGGRHHSSIIHLREQFDNLYKRDKKFTLKTQEVLKHV